LLQAPSQSPEAAAALRGAEPDLVLVDGDHTGEGCRADFALAASASKWVAVHDIVGEGYPGVGAVWRELEG
jgi:hypothetical protein